MQRYGMFKGCGALEDGASFREEEREGPRGWSVASSMATMRMFALSTGMGSHSTLPSHALV